MYSSPPWRWIAEKQRVWINGNVTLEDGITYEIPIRDGQAVTAEEVKNGVTSVLSRNELEKLLANSEIIIMTQVAFDGTTSGPRIAFPDTSVRISAAFSEGALEHFDSYAGRQWEVGETIGLRDMQIKILAGPVITGYSRIYSYSTIMELDITPNRPTPLFLFQGTTGLSAQYFHNEELLPPPVGSDPQYCTSFDKPITRIHVKNPPTGQTEIEWIFILR